MNAYSFLVFYKSHGTTFASTFFISIISLFITSCNFNILGGKNSRIDTGYNPGLRTESLPPTISPFADMDLDENDTTQIDFQIGDPDTVLFCSGINIAARSSNQAVIANSDMTISGTYPNCVLNVTTRAVTNTQLVRITIDVFDYWSTVSTNFEVEVRKLEKPGPFRITVSEGLRKSIIVHWSNSDYMEGRSARYTVYYKKVDDQTLQSSAFTGVHPVYTPSPSASQPLFTQIQRTTSPHWISPPFHTLDDGTLYEVYVTARNAYNNKFPNVAPEETNHVFVRTLDRFQFKVREFVTSSQQAYKPPAVHDGSCAAGSVPLSPLAEACTDSDRYFTQSSMTGPMERTSTLTASSRYRVYMNAQGLMYGESP
jgi:hypothetical protein